MLNTKKPGPSLKVAWFFCLKISRFKF